MFDTVGKVKKQDRGRQAGSLLVSLSVGGGLVAAMFFVGQKVVEEVVKQDEAVEVFYNAEAPPPPPPPPPPPAGKKKTKPKDPDPEPDPEPDPDPEPEELPEIIPDEPEVESDIAGEEGGEEGGVEGGVVGGVVGGEIGGVIGGVLGGTGVKAVHWSKVKAKRQVSPKFPEAAKALNLKEERCQVRFFIDEKGKPYEVVIEKCPVVFHASVKEAAYKWRFFPMKDKGKAVKSQFVLSILFKLR
jgi:periplasmic protein TonB